MYRTHPSDNAKKRRQQIERAALPDHWELIKKKSILKKKNLSKQLPRIQRIGRDTLATARPQAEIAPLGEPLDVLLGAGVVPAGLASPQVGPDLVGADELLVLVDDGAAEGTLEDDDFALRIEVLVKRFFLF